MLWYISAGRFGIWRCCCCWTLWQWHRFWSVATNDCPTVHKLRYLEVLGLTAEGKQLLTLWELWRPHSLQKVGSVYDIDVGMLVNIKSAACQTVMLCSMAVSYQRFRGTCWSHFHVISNPDVCVAKCGSHWLDDCATQQGGNSCT